ncbi:MAG: hypothetical protein ACK5MA_01855 [Parachlamydiaceae bacterium]
MQTIVIRHRKENLKKCSLRGLESREDMQFISYPFESLPPLNNYLMLVVEGAPPLTIADKDRELLFLDSTWRYLPKMVKAVEASYLVEKRVLPGSFLTAYPRAQEDCINPAKGLSTVEALYIAYRILGRDTKGLLDHYHWRDSFIKLNRFC